MSRHGSSSSSSAARRLDRRPPGGSGSASRSCATLLDGIGGSVLVESDGEHGSTFVIRFARARDLDPAL